MRTHREQQSSRYVSFPEIMSALSTMQPRQNGRSGNVSLDRSTQYPCAAISVCEIHYNRRPTRLESVACASSKISIRSRHSRRKSRSGAPHDHFAVVTEVRSAGRGDPRDGGKPVRMHCHCRAPDRSAPMPMGSFGDLSSHPLRCRMPCHLEHSNCAGGGPEPGTRTSAQRSAVGTTHMSTAAIALTFEDTSSRIAKATSDPAGANNVS